MGCGTSKVSYPDSSTTAPARSPAKKRNNPKVEIGRPVGGAPLTTDIRQAQLEAAERRAAAEANRGLGTTSAKATELPDAAKKQELIGRITAQYQLVNKEVPMGLNLASPEQLRHHLETIRPNAR